MDCGDKYIWEDPGWPALRWDTRHLAPLLTRVAREQGRLLGKLDVLGVERRGERQLRTLTDDVLQSSAIEGEALPYDQVRSSVARRLGLDIGGLVPSDRNVDGVVEMTTDATLRHQDPLTAERLFAWHAALFPTGYSGVHKIQVGQWRDDRTGPMQVVSGPIGKERVHYEAPPAERVDVEMQAFLTWYEQSDGSENVLLKAGLAHFWFVTIHPFDDGNGRIARAIADMTLARGDDSEKRFYSMSAEIRNKRDAYYRILERTQKDDTDITPWQVWFLECLLQAIQNADITIADALSKARFWQRVGKQALNDRQIKMLTALLDDFKGKLTTTKWAKMAKCSQDTALRDIQDLIDRGVLQKNPGGGRSTSYSLVYAVTANLRG